MRAPLSRLALRHQIHLAQRNFLLRAQAAAILAQYLLIPRLRLRLAFPPKDSDGPAGVCGVGGVCTGPSKYARRWNNRSARREQRRPLRKLPPRNPRAFLG